MSEAPRCRMSRSRRRCRCRRPQPLPLQLPAAAAPARRMPRPRPRRQRRLRPGTAGIPGPARNGGSVAPQCDGPLQPPNPSRFPAASGPRLPITDSSCTGYRPVTAAARAGRRPRHRDAGRASGRCSDFQAPTRRIGRLGVRWAPGRARPGPPGSAALNLPRHGST